MNGLICLICLATAPFAFADPIKVWVVFRDKGPGLPASGRNYEDAPLYIPYLEGLRELGFTPAVPLRWQNRISGYIAPQDISRLRQATGVQSVEKMRRRKPMVRQPLPETPESGPALPGPTAKAAAHASDTVFRALQGSLGGIGLGVLRDSLSRRGLKPGDGIRIAILDADFALGSRGFDAIWKDGRIKDQYDFVAGRPQAATRGFSDSHGAEVLSIIGGDLGELLQGAAPAAEFLLYRTENSASESWVEEDYLAAAMERAVDSGAQVVNISLGYRYEFDDGSEFPFSELDGQTRPSSIAVLQAARRDVLVTVSIGNLPAVTTEGPTLQAPADADSILAVGIENTQGQRCSYSCWGPTADGRIKPDIMGLASSGCSVPQINPFADSAVTFQGGTSFSAPALAGAAALLRQAFPEASAMAVRQALLRTAVLAKQPSDSSGYGLAQADLAWDMLANRQPGEKPSVMRYGPVKIAYPGDGVVWSLALKQDAPLPQGLYDLRGQWHPIRAYMDGEWVRLAPAPSLSRGLYVIP